MPLSPEEQHRKNAAIQQRWSTLAKREGNDNLRQAHRMESLGQTIRAHFYYNEAHKDFYWANLRNRSAANERRLAKR